MSLQLILGGSGSGKSTYIFDKIIERSLIEEEKNFFILVPDQFTMQTQMDIVSRHSREGIMNIDVLSFSRLSYRILEETGGGREPVLDDTGKSLVLRKVVGACEEELTVLRSNLKKIDYIHEVKSAISEFMQYGIGQKEMEDMLAVSRKRGGLHGKLKDLKTLYSGFVDYINEKFITTEETYDRLARQLEKSVLIRNSVVVLDGFTGFTPIQNRVLEKLMLLASEVYFTITIDKKEFLLKGEAEGGLFSLSLKTISSLKNMASHLKVEEKEPVWMQEQSPRYQGHSDLIHLEQNLFRYPLVPYKKETDSIFLVESTTMEEEVRQVCKQIRRLLKEGYCYRDIAVITGELGDYTSVVEELFEQYEIPFFLDETKQITLNPFIEYIRAALSVLVKQFSYEAVFHYLRSGMVDMDREKIDLLEQYCLTYGIKGRKTWSTIFVKADGEKNNLEELNRLRERLMEDFAFLKPGRQKVKKQAQQLYQLLVKNKCQEKLQKYEKSFGACGDKSKEKEYRQIYPLVMDLLDQITALLGEEALTWEELAQILDAGFGEIQVGIIPQAVDQVVVGNMERTRLKQVKALFFVGINEGKVPKTTSKGGILSDIDREFLADANMELAPTPRQQLFIQKFYLYLMITKPSSYLQLSYATLSGEGKTMKPSYFIEHIRKLFPAIRERKVKEMFSSVRNRQEQIAYEDECGTEGIDTFEEGRKYAALSLHEYRKDEMSRGKRQYLLSLLYLMEKENPRWTKQLLEGAFYHYEDIPISEGAARSLYSATLYSSVSRLEKMAACAYAHYLQYGLGLKERREYSFEAVDMGNVFHGVLEIFAGKLAENHYTWMNFPQEEGRRLLHEALENYAINYGNTILYATARNGYALDKIERILWRSVRTLQYQLQKGKFLPKSFELSFSALEDLKSVSIRLGEEEKLRLGGRIDRIDTYEENQDIYVKVIDYKSGNRQFQLAAFYHGLQLQLVMYLNAAMELEKKNNPRAQIHPGAFLYYHIEDPMVEGKEGITEEEIEQMIKQKLKVRGIVNSDPKVLEGLDSGKESKSDVIPVEYKKDGSLTARSTAMTGEQIGLLQQYAIKKAADIGREIITGSVGIRPAVLGSRDACTFCQFRQICSFDERLEGFYKRRLEQPEEEEILSRIRQEIEGEERVKR